MIKSIEDIMVEILKSAGEDSVGETSSTPTKEDYGVINVEVSEHTKQFGPFSLMQKMFDPSLSPFEVRLQELGAGELLDNEFFGSIAPSEAYERLIESLAVDKAEIESFERSNNEAWFLFNFVTLRFLISEGKNPEIVNSNSIQLGRLIEWWRWRRHHEVAAKQAHHRRKRAGEGSAKASTSSKNRRIESMLSAMEAIVSKNPDLKEKSARQTLANLAIKKAVKSDPKLWSQGKNQRDNYLSAMKTDKPFKKQFEALGLK